MLKRAEVQVKEYFEKNGWKSLKVVEGEVFYKNRDPTCVKAYDFLGYSKKKGFISAQEIVKELEDVFMPKKYQRKQSTELVRPKQSNTFFLTSGIQVFEDSLSKWQIPETTDSLFIQPVIRTNYAGVVGEGRISSFVNPSTVRFCCSSEQYVEDLDCWMEFLSKSGLYLGDFNLKFRNKQSNHYSQNHWKHHDSITVSFIYGGLRLGDASYHIMPTQEDKPFEDIGFGLERLVWARNKTNSFKEIVGAFPYAFSQDMKTIDTIRTISLMALSEVGRNPNADNQFRKYLLNLNLNCSDLEPQLKTYFDYWKQFIAPKKSIHDANEYIIKKVNEIRNTALLGQLGIKKTPKDLNSVLSQDQNSFINELILFDSRLMPKLRDLYCE